MRFTDKILILLFIILFITPNNIYATVFTPNLCTPNKLYDHVANQIDQRIVGLSGSDDDKRLFDIRGSLTSPWVYNADAWINKDGLGNIDLTGASPWNSRGGYTRAGTLITPQHAILAEHYLLEVGDTMLFVASDNTIVTRTVVAKAQIASTDIQLVKLNSPVPNTITHYPIIDSDTFEKYINDGIDMNSFTLPLITLDQQDNLLIKNIAKRFLFGQTSIQHNIDQINSDRFMFEELLIGGDSGNPAFVITGNKPVLLFTHFKAFNGPSLPYYKNQIESAIDLMGGEYDISDMDINCFDSPIVMNENPYRDYSTSMILGDSFGSSTVKYNIDNSPITFSIYSGNDSGYFAINTATGELTLATTSIPQTVTDMGLTINAVKNTTGYVSRFSYKIKQNIAPYLINVPDSLTISELLSNNSLVTTFQGYDLNNDALDYSIVSGNTNNAFSISTTTGQLRVNNNQHIDYDLNTVFNLTIRVKERNTVQKLSTDKNIIINIEDKNYDFTESEYVFSLDETIATSTFIGQVTANILDINSISTTYYEISEGNDNNYFSIDSSGNIYTSDNSTLENIEGGQIINLVAGVKPVGENDVYKTVPVRLLITNTIRPTLSIDLNQQVITLKEGETFSLKLRLSSAYSKNISGSLHIDNIASNAISTTDYVVDNYNFVFSPGDIEKTINIQIINDNISDNLESIFINGFNNKKRITENVNNFLNILILDLVLNTSISNSNSGGGGGGGSFSSPINTVSVLSNTSTSTNEFVMASSTNKTISANTITNNTLDKTINGIIFSTNLKQGFINQDVKNLQIFLNSTGSIVAKNGPGSKGNETNFFGPATRAALIRFQKSKNIKPASGFFGPITRNVINDLK